MKKKYLWLKMWVSVIAVTIVLPVSVLSGMTTWAAEQNTDELEASKNDLQLRDESVALYPEGDIIVQ